MHLSLALHSGLASCWGVKALVSRPGKWITPKLVRHHGKTLTYRLLLRVSTLVYISGLIPFSSFFLIGSVWPRLWLLECPNVLGTLSSLADRKNEVQRRITVLYSLQDFGFKIRLQRPTAILGSMPSNHDSLIHRTTLNHLYTLEFLLV